LNNVSFNFFVFNPIKVRKFENFFLNEKRVLPKGKLETNTELLLAYLKAIRLFYRENLRLH